MTRVVAVVAALLALAVPRADAATRAQVIVRLGGPATATTRAAVADAMGGTVGLVVAPDTFVVRGALTKARPAGVRWVAPDTIYRAARAPSDACYTACSVALDGQRELVTVRAPAAWDITSGSSKVVVAVLDGAVQGTHPDLMGKVVAGPSFVTNPCTNASAAEASHATGVAGLVGADTDNGIGIASLGWNTDVLAVSVLDPCGVGTASGVSAGIHYAVDHGANIVNLSLAGTGNPALADAVAYAASHDVVVVAAAGNGGSSEPAYPAAYDNVLAVGSTNPAGTALSTFSNRGPWVDLVAPGESVVSTATVSGGYSSFDGTSFSTPIAAAAAALVKATHPLFSAVDIANRLVRSVGRATPGVPVLDAGAALVDGPGGFVLAAADGGTFVFGDAVYRGSAGGTRLNVPVVAMAAVGSTGYWEAGSDGGVFAFGLPYYGSMGGTRLNQPIVGMAATPSGKGYFLVARDGGIFSFGDARFRGSTGAIRLNQPIVGMATTPTGNGYWLVARDGGIFAFGDARFSGSAGNLGLSSPIVGMAASSASAYWLAARDGGVYTYGGAKFFGSAVGNAGPGIVGMALAPNAAGYWLARADGVPLPFGNALDGGSTGPLRSPIVAIGSTSTRSP